MCQLRVLPPAVVASPPALPIPGAQMKSFWVELVLLLPPALFSEKREDEERGSLQNKVKTALQ